VEIGFTVGVWDLFHEGHRIFLERAKGLCDYLIVGVMTDYWVMVQKGTGRPIDSIVKRIEAITSLVDKVIVIDTMDMTPYLQIADIWIKGEDQNKMRPEVWSNEVRLPRTLGVSTTHLINNLYM